MTQRTARILPATMALLVGLAAVEPPGMEGQAPAAETGAPSLPPLRIAYFIPCDRKALANYNERLDRVMTEVQRFYREGMEANGYGPLTFELERDAGKRLRIYVVQGKLPMESYGRNDASKVRAEVKEGLKAQGVDIDREVVVIFQLLLKWDGDKAIEVGPYVGGGNGRYGTAWVYDDEKLDPILLSSKEPGGYYNRPCSLGQFNTHYIGGVAHELGHALGLPHDCESEADRKRGYSLMGGGNHAYGKERRGEGKGAFLSAASAMRLRYSRPFAGELPDAAVQPTSSLDDLEAQFENGRIVLTGTAKGQPPVWGLAAYDDLARIPSDYDAVGWTCRVADDGRFRLEIGEMRPGLSQLRIRTCHTNGSTDTHVFDYTVDDQRVPDIAVFRYTIPLQKLIKTYRSGDRQQTETLASELKQRFADVTMVRRKIDHLLNLLNPAPLLDLADVKPDVSNVQISRLKLQSASVGWGKLARDQVPEQCFLQVGGTFFESGLYAHAPSRFALALGGGWKRFRSGYGLQDGTGGSVIFVVRADGRELFRSPPIKDHTAREIDIRVEKVEQLEMLVEDAGDGNGSDWGVWLSPRLER